MSRLLHFVLNPYRNLLRVFKANRHPDPLVGWQQHSEQYSGKRILIATSLGCYEHAIVVERALAVALSLRGAKVEILLCDQALPCCQMTKIYNVTPEILLSRDDTPRCRGCVPAGLNAFERSGLQIHRYRQYLTLDDLSLSKEISASVALKDIQDFEYEGFAVGEHALAGALRYYARGNLVEEPLAEGILRRYLCASVLTVQAVRRLLEINAFTTAVFHHGIYVPQGVIGAVCRQAGVHVVNWNPAYRKHSFVFSHHDSYHHTMITERVNVWEDMDLDLLRESSIMAYLKSRWHGTEDWIWFHEGGVESPHAITQETGIDFRKPCIGLLTSVMWDAQLHYKSNAFRNMLDWTVQTIGYFRYRPDLQLLIRIHPAETTGMIPSRQKMKDEIDKVFPRLPSNVFIIPPESPISTYSAMQQCNSVIIYNTKAGIEISCMGIPVIVAGEAWIRNKGFSIDVSSPEDYFKVLDQLPFATGLSPDQLMRAKKYAYHFFFRRMIQLPFIISREKGRFELDLTGPRDLRRGNFHGLDVICDGILKGSPFIVD
jgi:hypothetical protein